MRIRDLLAIDFFIFVSVLLLTTFGILFIYSSGITSTGAIVSTEYQKQIIWAIAGLVIVMLLSLLDYRRAYDLSTYIYLGTILLLAYTLFFGRIVNGARSWIGPFGLGIQPSEFAKLAVILTLARYLDSSRHGNNGFKRFFISCAIVFLPMGLIILEPDLGTSLVFIPILLSMTFIAGVAMRYVLFLGMWILLSVVLLLLPFWQTYMVKDSFQAITILVNRRFVIISIIFLAIVSLISLFGFLRFKKKYFYWILFGASILGLSLLTSYMAGRVLKEYQVMRLIVFLDPYVDPRGSGWNIIQSVTAIGSGGFLGKGYMQGTQSHYRFLPQQSTDFIFSIFSEEWGLIGGILVFALFLIILLRMIALVKTTVDPFGSYLVAGFASMLFYHFIVNVGMTMGIMPITGIPLLFMSYGGSALITAMAGIGFCLSVYIRRYQH